MCDHGPATAAGSDGRCRARAARRPVPARRHTTPSDSAPTAAAWRRASVSATSRSCLRPLHFDGRRLGEELRLIDDRRDAIAQHVGADVEEQQRPRHEEERDDQQHRHEADEDVGDDQLAADAPEQPALDVDVEAIAERNRRRHQRDVADGVEGVEASRAADDQRQQKRDELDRRADQERASRERADQPLPNDIDARTWRRGKQTMRVGRHAMVSTDDWTILIVRVLCL